MQEYDTTRTTGCTHDRGHTRQGAHTAGGTEEIKRRPKINTVDPRNIVLIGILQSCSNMMKSFTSNNITLGAVTSSHELLSIHCTLFTVHLSRGYRVSQHICTTCYYEHGFLQTQNKYFQE